MSQKSVSSSLTPNQTPNSKSQRHGSATNKRPVFNSYISLFQVQEKLKKGEVIEGVLRINPKNYEDAYISAPDGAMDIFIGGVLDRNAALNGDIVAVELYSMEKWKILYDQLDIYLEANPELKTFVYSPVGNENDVHEIQNLDNYENGRGSACVNTCIEATNGNDCKKKKTRRGARGKKSKMKKEKTFRKSDFDGQILDCSMEADVYSKTNVEDNIKNLGNICCTTISQIVSSDEAKDDTCLEKSLSENLVLNEEKNPDNPQFNEILNDPGQEEIAYPDLSPLTKSKTTDMEFKHLNPRMRKRNHKKTSKTENTCSDIRLSKQTLPQERRSVSRLKKGLQGRKVPSLSHILRLKNWSSFIQRVGRVVSISEKKHPRVAAGILKPFKDDNPHFALFCPFDSRIPRMKLPMSQCPDDFKVRPQDYSSVILLARIVIWMEPTFAFGELLRGLGCVGDINAETEALLLENLVDFEPFPDEVALPSLPWSIPEEEIQQRCDLRQSLTFTIDPSTARDLDDAVSCRRLSTGNFEVGVHIADVSYFVRPDTLLDSIASQRATSVYLTEKVISMLPRELSEGLCSLNPGEDRLTFSVILQLSPEGEIKDQWFGRTVIRTCVKLSYDHAQTVIENAEEVWKNPSLFPPMSPAHSLKVLCVAITDLHHLAQKLRAKRVAGGALSLNQPKLCFSFDQETNLPNGLFVHEHKDSNKLIEEFMLLANIAVANKIYSEHPDIAVLRRHEPPHGHALDNIIQRLRWIGIHLDGSSSGALSRSIARYAGTNEKSMGRSALITNVCSRSMQFAKYFCTGVLKDEALFHHYALSVPYYTHFTSPIRRYIDILVHRLLASAINPESFPPPRWNPESVEKQMMHCNDKKQMSKLVQEGSSSLYLALFIRKVGEMIEKGIVVGVLDKAVDVLLIRLGIIKRSYIDKLPLASSKFTKGAQSVLVIEWKTDERRNLPPLIQTLSMLEPVTVFLRPYESHELKFNSILVRPNGL